MGLLPCAIPNEPSKSQKVTSGSTYSMSGCPMETNMPETLLTSPS